MTNPISGTSSINQTEAIRRAEQNKPQNEAQNARRTSTPEDRIEISEEAVARQAAEARAALENNQNQSLGLDPNFDTEA